MSGNSKLNMAFVANLFNAYPALPPTGDANENQEGNREDAQPERETREEKS